MNELELIARLTRDLPTHEAVVAGPGDDCALLDLGIPGRWVAFKTDAVVEGIHFTSAAAPRQVGHKALARVLSDFAAAAATPTAALITIALPHGFQPAWIEEVYAGLGDTARRWGVAIVGGETSTCPERTVISVAALGTVDSRRVVRRRGARPGDALFVSGELGGSLAGRHLEFEPRLSEARWLADHFEVHSMIDLSDGLASDLRHLLEADSLGADLLGEAIPISRAARQRARAGDLAKTPLLSALTDGEDFELLFAVASRDAVRLLDEWKSQFPDTRLSCVGKITASPEVRLQDRGGWRPMPRHGYVHFE